MADDDNKEVEFLRQRLQEKTKEAAGLKAKLDGFPDRLRTALFNSGTMADDEIDTVITDVFDDEDEVDDDVEVGFSGEAE